MRVRQALNFAIDRREALDGSAPRRPSPRTCQILPPNFQGYEPFCPFTLDRRQRRLVGPDLDAARALIEDADAAGKRVTLWASGEGRPLLRSSRP